MILPKERYPKSDTVVPKVRHCGTQSPTLRHPKSDTAGTPQQKASRGCQEATPIDYNLLRKKITN